MRCWTWLAVSVGSLIACAPSARRSAYEDVAAATPAAGDTAPGLSTTPDAGTPVPSCAASVSAATRAQVDIVFLIDTSGSMGEEAAQVQQNLNDFAQSIGVSGLDYNVVLIGTKTGTLPPIFANFPIPVPTVCVPPPLGGPNCSDGPRFHHLNEGVGSTDSLQDILDYYPKYEGWLRPSAYKIFVEVTDDNSTDLAWDAFDGKLLAMAPQQFGTASKRRYVFDSICGWKQGTPVLSSTKCSTAENTGDQYQHLSQLTGGTVESVCATSYASVFDNIASGLIKTLGCEFRVPKTPEGKEVDPTEVLVTYTPGSGAAARPLTQVTDASKCAANPDGWYYDDATAPTKILFCPSTCEGPGADTSGSLAVAVGCKAPPPK